LSTYRIAKKASVKQFIYISTIDVYDSFSNEDKSAVDSKLTKNGDIYGDTKIDAEKALLSEHSLNEDIKVTILRPGIIYGPKSKLWSYNIISRQLEGHWIDIQNDGIANLTYIEDLSRTVHFCIKNGIEGTHNVISDSIKWKNFLHDHNRIVTKSKLSSKQQVGKLQHRAINVLRGIAKSVFSKYKVSIMSLYTSRPLIRMMMKKVIAKLEAVPSDIETSVLNYPSRVINNNLKISEEYTPTDIGLKKTETWYKVTGLIN
jgi:dTDP-4-dehydrorhamnose reductase